MAVGEGDDDTGPAADGSQVSVEGGQEQVVRLLDADEGLWRISLDAVDAWTAGTAAASDDDKGPFARLLSA